VRPWLLITCGYPFSGKSTVARAVSDRLAMARVAVDDQHAKLGFDFAEGTPGEKEWLRAYRAAYRLIDRELGEGRSVVFDSVGFRHRDRERVRRIAQQRGARALNIWLDVSVDKARCRLEQNAVQPTRQQVPIGNFERIVSEFEPPDDDEQTVIYRPDVDPAMWVEQVLRPVIEGQGN
jgi:predicted kinase